MASTWNVTGCNATSQNGCLGAPCQDPTFCRSQFGFCGNTSAFCNNQSLFLPQGCPTFYPTFSPTTIAPNTFTSSPTIGKNLTATSNSNVVVAGTAGGLGSVFALGIFAGYYKYSKFKKRALEEWTLAEESRFKETFQTTHDFEKLCSVVPNRSRESVAYHAKLLLNPDRPTSLNVLSSLKNVYMESRPRYAFVSERRLKNVPKKITLIKSPGNTFNDSNRTITTMTSSSTVDLPFKGPKYLSPIYNSWNPLFYSTPRTPEPSY